MRSQSQRNKRMRKTTSKKAKVNNSNRISFLNERKEEKDAVGEITLLKKGLR